MEATHKSDLLTSHIFFLWVRSDPIVLNEKSGRLCDRCISMIKQFDRNLVDEKMIELVDEREVTGAEFRQDKLRYTLYHPTRAS